MTASSFAPRLGLWVALAAYLALGTAYALRTPLWQVPDEPAHFNYVAQVATGGDGWPRIEPGDYPAERLEALKAARFAHADLHGIAYEDHQPPAYYAAAALIWLLLAPGSPSANPDDAYPPGSSEFLGQADEAVMRRRADWPWQVHVLRLFGVLLGAASVWLTWLAARRLVPGDPWLAGAAALVVAGWPMFLTMTAAVNNDGLAYAVMAAAVVLGLMRLDGAIDGRNLAGLGGLLGGLALLTKLSAHPAIVVLVVAEVLAGPLASGGTSEKTSANRRSDWGNSVRSISITIGIALLLSATWFYHTASVYGANDILGTHRHDEVVVGQARTADWIAQHGWADYLTRLVTFTFDSLWGVFGWLGVFLDSRFYQLLALVSFVAALGFVRFLWRTWRNPSAEAALTRRQLVVVALPVLASVAGFAWWNLTYVQHQGRYLLYGIVGLALALVIGLREVASLLAERLDQRADGRIRRSQVASAASAGPSAGGAMSPSAGTAMRLWLPRLATYGFALGLVGLAWLSLVRYIVPGLTP